jgi:hypothetical protein
MNVSVNTDTYSESEEWLELQQEKFIAISLGSNCFPANHLRDHDLHVRSFPFDWNVTLFESLYSLIENDFEGYFDLEKMEILTDDCVLNKKYGFHFYHQFDIKEWYNTDRGMKADTMGLYLSTLEKYQRRVERFCHIMNSGLPVFLFRFEQINQEQAQQLQSLLQRKFPQSNFTLICIDEKDTDKNTGNPIVEWEPKNGIIHHILNPEFDLNEKPNGIEKHPAFSQLFTKLGLIQFDSSQNSER